MGENKSFLLFLCTYYYREDTKYSIYIIWVRVRDTHIKPLPYNQIDMCLNKHVS